MSSKPIYHKHHILPKHMGGTDDPSNLIRLTIEEHAAAHRKLYEEHGMIQDKLAWKGLSGMIEKQELIRILMSSSNSGPNNPMYGRSAIKEKNLKWYTNGSQTIYCAEGSQPDGYVRGRTIKNKRGPHPKEHRKKISNANKGHKHNPTRKVKSPDGTVFMSIKEAAQYCNLTVSQFRHRNVKNGLWVIL
jgi:hypothetical protein